MNSFAERVRTITTKIPRGRVATYGQVALAAGNPRAARAVGMIMSKNKDTKKVPCHRVVASDGSLTGYARGGISVKRKKLLAEGVVFLPGRQAGKGLCVDLSKSLWNPNTRSPLRAHASLLY